MTSETDQDRYSFLFDVATGQQEPPSGGLTEAEHKEVGRIAALLHMIDSAWDLAPSELDLVRARFLSKLAAREPEHPWVVEEPAP